MIERNLGFKDCQVYFFLTNYLLLTIPIFEIFSQPPQDKFMSTSPSTVHRGLTSSLNNDHNTLPNGKTAQTKPQEIFQQQVTTNTQSYQSALPLNIQASPIYSCH